MRAELAQLLLSEVMGWSTGEFQEYVPDLQALADTKYDEYGGYSPAGKFIENLAGWLSQFPPERRQVALDFVMEHLVFVSETEMRHLISLVPSSVIDSTLRRRVADQTETPRYRIAALERSPEFKALRRRSLVLGASDGARLDHLRRVSGLSHEQFLPTHTPSPEQLKKLVGEMANAKLPEGTEHRFEHVFLADDFAGSGRTLLRQSADASQYEGKIVALRRALEQAGDELVAANVPVTVIVYCASEQAVEQVEACLTALNLHAWEMEPVQLLRRSLRVTETAPAMASLCSEFFDESSADKYKGKAPLGYSDCALPVVLSHNAPNNSICLLWLDTRDRPDSQQRRALFPRYERHHPDRR